jgi:hypothetical protein
MPRKVKTAARKAGSKVARTTRKLTTKRNPRKQIAKAKNAPVAKKKKATVAKAVAKATMSAEPQAAKPKPNPPAARPVQRTSDVPIDLIAEWYTPKQTSLKGSFRSDGSDQQNDQEISLGDSDRFQDEDHFTNKSGDARIGTHGRASVPAEARRRP